MNAMCLSPMLALLLTGGSVFAQEERAVDDAPPNRGVVQPVAIESGGKVRSRTTTRKDEAAGKLSYLQVGMSFDEVPLKQALRTFFTALDLDYVPYFRGGSSSSGMLPDVPVSLEIRSISAHRGLDLLMAAGAVGEPCTWQLRGGVVEVGTLARLGRSGEPRPKVYEIKDLTLDTPYFDSTPPPNNRTERQLPREVAAQLMHHIMTATHPEAWQPPSVDDDTIVTPISPNGRAEWSNLEPFLLDERTKEPIKSLEVFVIGRWAKMHYHRDDLLVTGPDFIHRALNGYPGAVMPDPRVWKVPVVAAEKESG